MEGRGKCGLPLVSISSGTGLVSPAERSRFGGSTPTGTPVRSGCRIAVIRSQESAPAATPVVAPAPARRRWTIIGLLFAAILVNYIDRGNLSIAAVPLMR